MTSLASSAALAVLRELARALRIEIIAVIAAVIPAISVVACDEGPQGPRMANGVDAVPTSGPPAGRAPCKGAGARDARAAAVACFTSRVKPGLGALTKSRRLEELHFGSAEYLRTMLEIAPAVATTGPARTTELSDDALRGRIALGDPDAVKRDRTYTQVELVLRAPGTPDDGELTLVFVVDAATLDTPLVYRVLGG